jgi:cytidine deaminase
MQDNNIDQEKMQKLHQLALESRARAYCPYSNFAVGSCILGANGKFYTGCNIEKAVCSLCAEQTAIAKMVEDGCRQIKEVYVVTELSGEQLAAPCGYCRQYIK